MEKTEGVMLGRWEGGKVEKIEGEILGRRKKTEGGKVRMGKRLKV